MRKVITINYLSDVKNFQGIILTKSVYPITLSRGTFMCDAKSLLGIFSIDTSIPFEIEYNENEAYEVIDIIDEFACTPAEINEYMSKYYKE